MALCVYSLIHSCYHTHTHTHTGVLFDLLSDGTKLLTSFSGSRLDLLGPREWAVFATEEYHRLMD